MPHLLQMCHPYGVWLVFQWMVATNVSPLRGFWNVAFGPWGNKCVTPMGFITFSYVDGCYKCATPMGFMFILAIIIGWKMIYYISVQSYNLW